MTAKLKGKYVGKIDEVLMETKLYTEAELKAMPKEIERLHGELKKLDEKIFDLMQVKENAS